MAPQTPFRKFARLVMAIVVVLLVFIIVLWMAYRVAETKLAAKKAREKAVIENLERVKRGMETYGQPYPGPGFPGFKQESSSEKPDASKP